MKSGERLRMFDAWCSYRELVTSPTQLAYCQQATSVAQFLARVKKLWNQDSISDEVLLAELHRCNQQVLDIDPGLLGGLWLPFRYHAKTRTIAWCLPQGHPVEPFHDQYIERCRQQVCVNQLLIPKISLAAFLTDGVVNDAPLPAGFIFHLSRCGSTLISGCLAECDTTHVLSESPLLTEILLDATLSVREKQRVLPRLIAVCTGLFPARQQVIIKWNAWDILAWDIIRGLYPQVPVVLLVREPVEILASHQRMAGRHMAGDPSMAVFNSVLARHGDENIVDFRIRILHALLTHMLQVSDKPHVQVIDYRQLRPATLYALSKFFDIPLQESVRHKIIERMSFNSKEPGKLFQPDSLQKQQLLDATARIQIANALISPYGQLLLLAKIFICES